MNPRVELIGRPIGHLAALGLLGAAGYKGMAVVFHAAETGGDAIEAAYSASPTSEHVSAGPRSAVPWDTIGREGRRFVNMALTVKEIEAVVGGPAKPPIRVFVGLEITSLAYDLPADDATIDELDRVLAAPRAEVGRDAGRRPAARRCRRHRAAAGQVGRGGSGRVRVGGPALGSRRASVAGKTSS
jgi:hypothetical protein